MMCGPGTEGHHGAGLPHRDLRAAVKFKLGGNNGLKVLADGYPKSGATSCGSAWADEIEQTVSSATSSLTYDPASTQYAYTWKTPKASTGVAIWA